VEGIVQNHFRCFMEEEEKNKMVKILYKIEGEREI
jgi:hypothetical protein